jgi:molybdopterin synthase sulfur carrier subunit
MIAVHYFASIRENLGKEAETFELPEGVATVAQLIDHLIQHNGSTWSEVFADNAVMIAVNHEMTDRSAILSAGDEVAFFPPVTGG